MQIAQQFTIYLPLGKAVLSFDTEEEAVSKFESIFSDAILMKRGKVVKEKQYIKSYEELIHAALNSVCDDDNISFPDEEVMRVYCDLLPMFKDRKKGVFIIGDIGVGKTTAMKVFSLCAMSGYIENVNTYRVVPLRKVAQDFIKTGYDAYEIHSIGQKFKTNICIDDVGVENVNLKLFGNNVYVLPELVMELYETSMEYKTITHFTSNLLPQEIQERYGERTFDRMVKMSSVYTISGDSKRI